MSKFFGTCRNIEIAYHELLKYVAENFLLACSLKDYFQKKFIHSNNQSYKGINVLEVKVKQAKDEEINMEVILTEEQQMDFKRALKRGIYKELYKRGILSEEQLNCLIERNF